MSSWDAPTGNWESRPEPDEAGGPGEQDYQQGEPAGGHHAGRGGEGRMRAGRRGLPGYDQAQAQAGYGYPQQPYQEGYGAYGYQEQYAYPQQQGYGQQGYGQEGYPEQQYQEPYPQQPYPPQQYN